MEPKFDTLYKTQTPLQMIQTPLQMIQTPLQMIQTQKIKRRLLVVRDQFKVKLVRFFFI